MLKFFAEKIRVAFATHIFSAQNTRILCIKSAKTVNEMTLNKLINDALNNRALYVLVEKSALSGATSVVCL